MSTQGVSERRVRIKASPTIVYGTIFGVGCACFLCMTLATAQSNEGKQIILNHADSLVGKMINGETVREVIGRVEFTQGEVVVRCDRAIHYPGPNRAELYGNVTVKRDTVTLTAPRGIYDGEKRQAFGFDGVEMWTKRLSITAQEGNYLVKEKVAYFEKDVKVVDSATTITSRELTYYEDEHRSVAVGDVRVVNSRDNATMFGNYLEHFDDRKYSKMLVAPKFVQVDTSSSGKIDTLVIISKQMESYDDSVRRFIATDSLQLVRGELAGENREGVYYSNQDIVILHNQPIIWYQDNQVTGDSVRIYLRKRRLDRVWVQGNTFAVSQSDSLAVERSEHGDRFNQLTSQSMTLYFANDALQHIDAEGTAVSLYFLYEDGKPNGVNKSSGDKIFVYSKDGRTESIKVVGGTEGKFFPENLVNGSVSSYSLPGFRWRTDRPRLGKDLSIVALPFDKNERTGVKK